MKCFLHSYILISVLLLSIKSSSQTQQVKFNPVVGTNGISLGKINAITKDKYGFIWFSDQSNRCIIKFDGSHMTRYQNDPKNSNTLGGYYPECLFADTAGNIWIGFYGMGFDKFDPVKNIFTHYRNNKNDASSLSNDFVTAILIDHLGNIWVGNYGGVDLLDEKTGKFKHYSNKAGDLTSLSCNTVRALYEDRAGVLWVGTGFPFDDIKEGGLNRYNRSTGNFTRYMSDPKNPHTLINDKVRAIFEDSYGNFWVGTKGDGLHTMDRKTGLFTRYPYNPARPDQLSRTPLKDSWDHITFITEDEDKKIWIGTLINGLIRYDPIAKKVTHYGSIYDTAGALKDSSSWCAKATTDGLIWLSTQRVNLFKIDIYNTIIPHFDTKKNSAIISGLEEGDSIRWTGFESGLVRKDLRNGTTRRFVNEPHNPNSLSNNVVTGIIKIKQGDLWIGTINGLNHLNINTGKYTRYKYDTGKIINSNNIIIRLCADRDSNIWAATNGNGIYMLNRQTEKFTTFKNDPADINTLSNDYISAMLVYGDNLWIGTYNNGGLNKLNTHTGKFTHYLPGLVISTIYKDAADVLWIGTPGGLFQYDKKSDIFTSNADENAGNNITQIASITGDKEDNLWIAARSGIHMLNKKRDQLTYYGKENGISEGDNFFNWGAAQMHNDGELIFTYDNGYYAFYPDKLKTSLNKTQLYFTRFWLNNTEIIPGNAGPIKQSLYNTKEILLKHDQNVFSFSATFIDFHNPSDKNIFYKLENYDHEWHSSVAEERIQYFNLPHGKYILRIKTANTSNGEWIEKGISIIISPPWWSTWWAYTFYGLCLLAGIFFTDRIRRKVVIERERAKTKERELAQAKEIEKAYKQLEVTHETLKATQAQLIQSEKMASLGELTAGIAHEIQNPLNFVNNFSEVSADLVEEMREELLMGNNQQAISISNDLKENLVKINHHGRRADSIVKGMLQHSRASTGEKEPTDINALADEYLRLSYHGFRAKDKDFNANFTTDFDESTGAIEVVPEDIGRVLLNLYNNAFYSVNEKNASTTVMPGQASYQGQPYEPTVSVSTKRSLSFGEGRGEVIISVKDNGNGIPQKIVDKIFQPFFTTKPTGQGTGLGLSLSYDIIKAHGGELKVETKEGEGTEFIVHLPAI